MTRALVVGGGIAGLAAARRLATQGLEVTVLEAGGRVGGKLEAGLLDGVSLDTGAESILARRPEAVGLATELGLADRLVHPTAAKPQLLVGGRLHDLPPSAQGVPTDLAALRPLLSADGWTHARREPDLPAPALPGDVAVGGYVADRFGPEVTDRLLEPLLGGVYAGRSRELSFAAVLPALWARARRGGSLLAAARDGVPTGAARPAGPVFAGLVGGVSTLVDALVADLADRGVVVRTNTVVRELVRDRDGRYALPGLADGVDAVVLAVPAAPAGWLLAGLVPAAARYAAVPYASVAVVTLVVRGLRTEHSGVLVPPGELPTVKAMTHSSAKWDWVRETATRTWGPGAAVVRASVGRYGEAAVLQVDDRTLVARTLAEVSTLPGWDGTELLAAEVTRWGGGLPQYRVGHAALVADLRGELTRVPGLAVAGAALDGVGVAACLASADAAAGKVTADLGAGPGTRNDERQESRT